MNRSMNSNVSRTQELEHESLGAFLVKLVNKFLGTRK
jgi:hypothetical protein